MNIQGWSPLGRLIDLFAVQRILKSLLQHHNLKPSTLLHSDFLWYKTLTSIHDYWKKHVCLCVSDSLQFHGLWPPPGSSAHGDSPGKNPGVCFYALLQGIFPTQGSNLGLPHCGQILYCLSHQWSGGQRICMQCRRHRFYPWVRKMPWRREWLPTPVENLNTTATFRDFPGGSHGKRRYQGLSQMI